MLYVGIDNGVSGYIGEVDGDLKVQKITHTPVRIIRKGKKGKRTQFDMPAIREIMLGYVARVKGGERVFLCLERSHAMPRHMSSSITDFNAGQSFGMWEMACVMSRLPYITVDARTWQGKLLKDAIGENTKDRSLDKAIKMFPECDFRRTERCRTLDAGKADSIWLAIYGAKYGDTVTV